MRRLFLAPTHLPNGKPSNFQQNSFAGPLVRIGDTTVFVEVATTSVATQKGLSGRDSLAFDHGMLFIFPKPDFYPFWMPDMRFPIDIIWINNGKIVGINENVSNDFDPANPRFYLPPKPAQYVLEVNVGFSEAKNIAVGDTVILSDI